MLYHMSVVLLVVVALDVRQLEVSWVSSQQP